MSPQVRLIAQTMLLDDELYGYLNSIGAGEWDTDARSDGEALIEAAGRLCYKSWKPGLNPNVTKVREGNLPYMANILKSRHGSVLEHASATWLFQDVSRVFTHELVRHRVGVAISQESLRYVRLTELDVRVPAVISDVEPEARALVKAMEDFQVAAAKRYKLDEPGSDFARKKEVTSALRRFAPIGLATNIMWTANLRTLRNAIEVRTEKAAEEEMRLVFGRVAEIALEKWPAVFQDFTVSDDGTWTSKNRKV